MESEIANGAASFFLSFGDRHSRMKEQQKRFSFSAQDGHWPSANSTQAVPFTERDIGNQGAT